MPIAIELNPGPYLLKDFYTEEEFEQLGPDSFRRFVNRHSDDILNALPPLADLIRRVWWEEEATHAP